MRLSQHPLSAQVSVVSALHLPRLRGGFFPLVAIVLGLVLFLGISFLLLPSIEHLLDTVHFLIVSAFQVSGLHRMPNCPGGISPC